MKRLILVFAFLALAGTYGLAVHADVGGEPPIVTILDENFVDTDSITVMYYQYFVLYGTAIGESPLYYFWYYGGDIIATGTVLTNKFDDPGEYLLTLEVVDVNGLSGYDTMRVKVEGIPVSNESVSWGRIKAISR
jgi:hypothetical protein